MSAFWQMKLQTANIIKRSNKDTIKALSGLTFMIYAEKVKKASLIPKEPGVILTNKERVLTTAKNKAITNEMWTLIILNSKNKANEIIKRLSMEIKIDLSIMFLFDLILDHPSRTLIRWLTNL